jgi:hypothetical protein
MKRVKKASVNMNMIMKSQTLKYVQEVKRDMTVGKYHTSLD